MRYDNSDTGSRLNVFIEGLELPADEEARVRLFQELEAGIESILEDNGFNADDITSIGGHSYTTIRDRCPQCSKQLKLIEPELDKANGALARATCECGWYGDAVYRLIDLHERQPGTNDDDAERSGSLLDITSSIEQNDIEPQYYPY